MSRKPLTVRQAAIKHGWRSGLEEAIAEQLTGAGVSFVYEPPKPVRYKLEEEKRYTPDFVLPNGIIIETKGRFVTADRKKHKLIKAQHPDLDIRFVFSNAKARISKTSKTTYAKWSEDHGFLWAHRSVPDSWLREPINPVSLAAARRLME